jgi:hypothetical protein
MLLLPAGVLLLVVSARVMFLLLSPPRTFLPSSIVILLLLPVKNDFARRSFPTTHISWHCASFLILQDLLILLLL